VRNGDDFLAVTEAPDMLQFEPRNLGAIGIYEFEDALRVQVSSAHPHYDFERRTLINFALEFGAKNKYHFYGLKDGSRQRQLIASLPTRHPSYIHTFGMTENYIVLVEFPLFFNVLALATSMKTFAESASWQPETGSFFHLIRKSDGTLVKTYEAAPFFCFHHINAYEENGDVIVDLAAYYDSEIVQSLYLKALHAPGGGAMPHSQFRRYWLAANSNLAEYTPITSAPFEIPHLNYRHNGSKPYRYAYAMSWRKERPNDFYNALIKVDTHTGEVKRWFADDCYPGEPVFVPRPDAQSEDDGVNLSIVLDGNTKRSFLLALDSATFEEIARAELSDFIPFHFHGGFSNSVTAKEN
jgi:beta,beta-carotene 9',10'-dioxygenase